jgi:hypothetical protein
MNLPNALLLAALPSGFLCVFRRGSICSSDTEQGRDRRGRSVRLLNRWKFSAPVFEQESKVMVSHVKENLGRARVNARLELEPFDPSFQLISERFQISQGSG